MRIAPAMLALLAGIVLVPLGTPVTPIASVAAVTPDNCTDWTSTTEPPPSIRVYRESEGLVEEVDFKTYVIRVMYREWNVRYAALRRAGAVAVKQYAWYQVLHYRGGVYNGECYDVKDTTADQLYDSSSLDSLPNRVKRATEATWDWTMWRGDRFFSTTYRTGKRHVPCAEDAGKRLKARSARKCAKQGWSAQQILEVYYTATLDTGTDPPPEDASTTTCTAWDSTTQPPLTINVYRVSLGRVDKVDFKTYVKRVVYSMWNSPYVALRKAGAVAAKEYAWYQVLNYRGGSYNGQCYDVKDTSADQPYANVALENIPRRVKSATNKSWGWTLSRGDGIFSTTSAIGQRNMACAEDAGSSLMKRSARKCASQQGWNAQQILETYYSATLDKGA